MPSVHVSGRRARGTKPAEPGFLKRLLLLVTLAWLLRWVVIEAASHWARIRARRQLDVRYQP
jgi:hypothetical protein